MKIHFRKQIKSNTLFKIFVTLVVVMVVFLVFTFFQNNSLTVTTYEITSAEIPDSFVGYKIMQLSDLHSKSFGNENENLINKIDELNPDIIVMTGDMLNSMDDEGAIFLTLVSKLSGKYPIYFVLGNHEQSSNYVYPDFFSDYMNELLKYDITFIDDTKIEIEKENQYLNLYGLNLPFESYCLDKFKSLEIDEIYNKQDILSTLGSSEDNKYNILLTHSPTFFSAYADWGADLILTGHFHGGVVRIPFLGGLFSPEHKLFPEYDAGQFVLDSSNMIVSRGLGNAVIIFRVFNTPEIVIVELNR